jgi:hypothetical protein
VHEPRETRRVTHNTLRGDHGWSRDHMSLRARRPSVRRIRPLRRLVSGRAFGPSHALNGH